MTDADDREQPDPDDLGTWTVGRLEAFTTARRGRELERVRGVVEGHAYRSAAPRGVRLRWAELSPAANDRLPGGGPRGDAHGAGQNVALRTWAVEHLGPGGDRDRDPGAPAADTPAAPTLDPDRAVQRSADRRSLPAEEIGEPRRHENTTAHLSRLLGFVPPGPAKDRLAAWARVRDDPP